MLRKDEVGRHGTPDARRFRPDGARIKRFSRFREDNNTLKRADFENIHYLCDAIPQKGAATYDSVKVFHLYSVL